MILSQRFGREKVEAEVEAREPCLVVIAQSYYPCWHAYVDGQSVPLLRANVAFQALQVPAGRHTVRVVYDDHAFRIGAVISGLALLGCMAGWILGGRKYATKSRSAAVLSRSGYLS